MKKNYVYFIAPLAGLAVFFAIYWNYSAGYEARLENQKKADREELQKKLDEEARGRLQAATEAKKAQDDRKEQKRLKDLKDAEDADRRERAVQARNRALRDADKLAAQVKRLKKDIEDEQTEISKIEEDRKRLVAEQKFIRDYVKKSEDNTRNLLSTLDKVVEADKKWDEANKEAARLAASKR